jgi:hypothetical protein
MGPFAGTLASESRNVRLTSRTSLARATLTGRNGADPASPEGSASGQPSVGATLTSAAMRVGGSTEMS